MVEVSQAPNYLAVLVRGVSINRARGYETSESSMAEYVSNQKCSSE